MQTEPVYEVIRLSKTVIFEFLKLTFKYLSKIYKRCIGQYRHLKRKVKVSNYKRIEHTAQYHLSLLGSTYKNIFM